MIHAVSHPIQGQRCFWCGAAADSTPGVPAVELGIADVGTEGALDFTCRAARHARGTKRSTRDVGRNPQRRREVASERTAGRNPAELARSLVGRGPKGLLFWRLRMGRTERLEEL